MKPALIITAVISSVVVAVPHASQAQAKTPEAVADQLIEAAKAADVFENVTSDQMAKVRHKASGMNCYFLNAHPGNSLRVYEGGERGSDVSCGSYPAGMVLTMFAVRPPRTLTLQQATAQYIAEVRNLHPDAKPPENKDLPPLQGMRGDGLPNWMIARFQISTPQGPAYSRLAVSLVDGWVVEQRLTTYPGQDWAAADRVGEGAMVLTLQDMVRQKAKP